MARIIFRVHVDAGGGNICVPQIVAHSLEIHVVALMGACCMPHPVGGGLLHMRGGGLMVRPHGAQAGCGFTEDGLTNSCTALRPIDLDPPINGRSSGAESPSRGRGPRSFDFR